jgi:hypothetical protein
MKPTPLKAATDCNVESGVVACGITLLSARRRDSTSDEINAT